MGIDRWDMMRNDLCCELDRSELVDAVIEARRLAEEWRHMWDMNAIVPNSCCSSSGCCPPTEFPWDEVGHGSTDE